MRSNRTQLKPPTQRCTICYFRITKNNVFTEVQRRLTCRQAVNSHMAKANVTESKPTKLRSQEYRARLGLSDMHNSARRAWCSRHPTFVTDLRSRVAISKSKQKKKKQCDVASGKGELFSFLTFSQLRHAQRPRSPRGRRSGYTNVRESIAFEQTFSN